MAGLPTVVVKVDDGTGTYPTTITSSVRMVEGLSISGYGRSDTFDSAEASTLTFTVDNVAGAFSTGAGALSPGQGVRVSLTSGATTVNRFTGKITTLELGWPDGGQEFSVINVSASDPLAELSRRIMRSMLEQEILLGSPSAYYTLGEAAGSTSAGDTSGNGSAPLTITGSGSPVVFGNGIGPGTDGLTAAQLAGGQYLVAGLATTGALPTTFAIGCWFNVASNPTSEVLLVSGSGARLMINTAGLLAASGAGALGGGGAAVADGLTHFAVAEADGVSFRVWLDGVLVSTLPVVGGTGTFSTGVGIPLSLVGSPPLTLTGTVSHFAIWPSISAATIAAIYSTGGGASETTDARLTRVASYAGMTATTTSGSGQMVSAQDTTGQSVLDALQAVADAEGGVFFADGSAALQMQGRDYRAQKTTATLAMPAEEPDPGTTIPYDTTQLINQMAVTRTGGAAQTFLDAASITAVGLFPQSLDLIVADDPAALSRAQWLVNKYKTPTPRIATLTVEPSDSITTPASLLSLKIGDRVSLVLPSQNWTVAGDYIIEGWTETVTADAWTIAYNVVPWSLYQAAIWDDSNSKWDAAVWL